MATINGLTTLATTALTSSDQFVVYDASAATDKKTPAFTADTWTPALNFGGATTGITYSGRAGNYIRIGQLVMATLWFGLSSKGSATGNATITGLPYTALATANIYYAGAVRWGGMAAAGYVVQALLPQGSATISLYVSTASVDTAAMTNAAFGNSTSMTITIMYEAAVS